MKTKLVWLVTLLCLIAVIPVFAGGDKEHEIILGTIPVTLVAGYHQSDAKWAQMYA